MALFSSSDTRYARLMLVVQSEHGTVHSIRNVLQRCENDKAFCLASVSEAEIKIREYVWCKRSENKVYCLEKRKSLPVIIIPL
jgi:hypothetical protein